MTIDEDDVDESDGSFPIDKWLAVICGTSFDEDVKSVVPKDLEELL